MLEDVILGCAYPEAPQGNNLARVVALLAGLPTEVGRMTANRFCCSSMQAVHIAAAQIEAWNRTAKPRPREQGRLADEIVPITTPNGEVVRQNARYALATQCVGGGQGIATILERI